MDIKTYQSDIPPNGLTDLLQKKYGSNENFDYFLSDFTKAFSFCMGNKNIEFLPVAAFEEGEMRAHIALIRDKRLPADEAFFGFLEVPEDTAVFNTMWNNLVKEAHERGISVLKGPINGSIWHQYRCTKESDGSDFFKTELCCEPYYYNFLISKKPTTEVLYYSASREPFEIVLQMISKDSYEKLEALDFSIRTVKPVALKDLYTIADISKTVFQSNWGYTELDEQEFLQLYSSEKLDVHLSTVYFLYKGDDIIGFCSTFIENHSTLILKTICILPPYQNMGLGNALAYKIHLDAKEHGLKKIIYAQIREGNNIKNFPKEGIVVFRRYAAFEFHI